MRTFWAFRKVQKFFEYFGQPCGRGGVTHLSSNCDPDGTRVVLEWYYGGTREPLSRRGDQSSAKFRGSPTVQEKVCSAVLATLKPHALALPRAPKASKTRPKKAENPPPLRVSARGLRRRAEPPGGRLRPAR